MPPIYPKPDLAANRVLAKQHLVFYPSVQKYFTRGVLTGATKG
jgi:hypothetical protein